MKNVYLKKNKLKDLIYIQENKPCSSKTVEGLFRSLVEPVLEENIESIILCRLEPKSQKTFGSLLKRLRYSKSKVYDYSDTAISTDFQNLLKQNIWDKTEFIYVLTERFGAALIFDYEESEIEGFASIYILHNSKFLSDVFDVINDNSTEDLSELNNKYHPDRRENITLNNSIRKIVSILNDSNSEILISELGKQNLEEQEELVEKVDYISEKTRLVSHELRNQLSICSLYSAIVGKRLDNIEISDEKTKESIQNALKCISTAVQIADNSLLDLKTLNNTNLENYNLKELIDTAVNLSEVYKGEKEIKITSKIDSDITILADENRFKAVIINMIKNAIESIEKTGKISIVGDGSKDVISLRIFNTGKEIEKEKQENIFDEGFTTKKTGSGLGLFICKKTLEEQFAQLRLIKSDKKGTEFEILLPKIKD
jgi:signal transduction histidine kinase